MEMFSRTYPKIMLSAPQAFVCSLLRKEGKGRSKIWQAIMAMFGRHQKEQIAKTLPLPASPYKGEVGFEIDSRQVWRLEAATRLLTAVISLLAFVHVVGCKGMPTLEQQEQMVRANNLVLERVTTRAVVNVWGKPPHHHSEFTHFFVMPDRSMIPRSRAVSGEPPKGWNAGVHAGDGVFFAYPERGWLLVFLDEQLVYKEELKPEQMQALVNAWAYEDRFRTKLDGTHGP